MNSAPSQLHSIGQSQVLAALRRAAPLLVVLLPVLGSLLAGVAGARPSASRPASLRQPLAFHQYMLNLGEVDARREHAARFSFTNTSDGPMKLHRVATSCGCLSQHLENRIYQPGERGEFYLQIQTAGQTAGAKQYSCTAFYGPPDNQSVEYSTDLVFRISLPERSVSLSPRVLIFHQERVSVDAYEQPLVGGPASVGVGVAPGEHHFEALVRDGIDRVVRQINALTTHTVEITDLRERTLNVTGVSTNSPLVHATVVPATDIESGARYSGVVGRVQVTVGAVPAGDQEVLLRVHTDDIEFDRLTIPIRLHGP